MQEDIYSFKIIENLTTEKLFKYQALWDRLYLNNKELTPFQSFQWNLRLIKNLIYKGNANLAIFYKNNEPIIIFPYVINRDYFIFRVIKFLGTDTHADYLNFIYNKEISIADFQNFWKMLSKHYSKFIFNLQEINEISKIKHFINYENKCCINTETYCYQIPIYDNETEYFNSLGKRTRKEIKYYNNKIFRNFGKDLKFQVEISDLLTANCMQNFLTLYLNRLKIKYGKTGFDSNYESFLQDILMEAYKKDKIFSASLYNEDKLYAINLGFYSPNCKKIYLMIVAINSNLKGYNIGNILLYKTISDLCSNKDLNIEFYDLTRGDELYKKKYGGKLHKNINFIISRHHISMFAYDFLYNFRTKLSKIKNSCEYFMKLKK